MKVVKRILLALLILILIFAAHTLLSTGFFRTIENHFEGEIIKTIKLPGAEDITISHEDSFAIISSTDRAVFPPQEQEEGGLFFMDLKKQDFSLMPMTSDLDLPFAPHGISIIKTDTFSYKVLAINHTAEGHSIEEFELGPFGLQHRNTRTDETMISPNDLVLLDENRFYFTNDHGYTEGFGKIAEEYAGLSLSNVIYFDGENYREVASGIAYANGINYDSVRNYLYVASPRKFLIKVYAVKENGDLEFIENIDCDTGIDNLELDLEGNIWTGGHPNLLRFSAYSKGKKETAPSEILKITYRKKGDYLVEKIFSDDGTIMSGASVAAPFGQLILAGNVMDEEFLILKID